MNCFHNNNIIIEELNYLVKEQRKIIDNQQRKIDELEKSLDSLREASKLNDKFLDYHKYFVTERKKYVEIVNHVDILLKKYKL